VTILSSARRLAGQPIAWRLSLRNAVLRFGLALAMVASVFSTAPAPVSAATRCWCMDYVQNYIGHINAYYAKDAGPALRAMGYRESSTPMGINDVVVMQPNFAGADPTAGHIAFLASYRISGSTVTIMLRGANQPGGWWTDHGCYNVSQWTFSYTSNWGIRFYRK